MVLKTIDRTLRSALLLLVAFFASLPAASHADTGWVQWPVSQGGNGHWYRAISRPSGVTWSEANAAAQVEGGYLATLTDQAEFDFLVNLTGGPTNSAYWYKPNNGYGPWIGLFQSPGSNEPADGWRWVTQESLSFTRWSVNAPDNGNPNEDFGILFWAQSGASFGWQDMNNDGRLSIAGQPVISYIVERETAPEIGSIVFHSHRDGDSEIYTMNPDGSGLVRLTSNTAEDSAAAWSPDGMKIAFNSSRDGNNEIYVMNADGSNQTRLTNNPANDELPCWSPDGTKIAFVSSRDGNNEIYVMNADGSNQTRLTNNPGYDYWPDWSPDGAKVAFQSDRTGNDEVYVMNPDGSNVVNLTNYAANDTQPRWSPDSSKLVFTSNRAGNDEIYIMNANGSSQINLTNNAGFDQAANWSADGTKILFDSNRSGNEDIFMVNADGSNPVNLTDFGSNDYLASWRRLPSPILTLNPSSVAGGVQTSGTVTFAQTAPTQRLVLMTDNSDYVLMSTYCIVPANQTTGTFNIWTYGVANTTVATITAQFSGVTRTANLTLTPAVLDLLWVSPTAVVGGNPSMGNVRLVGKAPVGGALVALATSNPAAANHASSVTVSYGASLRQFPISTFGVDTTKNVVISATYLGVTRTASISVRPAALSSLSLATNTVKGGNPVVATVTMTGKTGPSGRTVFLFSNQPKIVVPGSMYVPPQKFSWNFTVLTQSVTSNTVGTITATQGATTRTATLTLTP